MNLVNGHLTAFGKSNTLRDIVPLIKTENCDLDFTVLDSKAVNPVSIDLSDLDFNDPSDKIIAWGFETYFHSIEELVEILSVRFPEIIFIYEYNGCDSDISGYFIFLAGNVLECSTGDYSQRENMGVDRDDWIDYAKREGLL